MLGKVKLCECGCGLAAPLAPHSLRKNGWVKGEPLKFVHGHNRRKHVDEYVVDEENGCWVWVLGVSGKYGMRNNVSAHRKYYEIHKGPIPEGLEIDHTCRNTLCVNPKHLEAVTHAENLRRRREYEMSTYGRVLGGRYPKGHKAA